MPAITLARAMQLLVVEDNDDDIELMKIGFERSGFNVMLSAVSNGEACMAFLRKEAGYADAITPDLILLDLNMPRMGGLEVLREINRDDRLRHLPIVVLSSSDADADVMAAWQLRCSGYIVKSLGFESFARTIRVFAEYWFTVMKLPPQSTVRGFEPIN